MGDEECSNDETNWCDTGWIEARDGEEKNEVSRQ
jgi:hypothetical protein